LLADLSALAVLFSVLAGALSDADLVLSEVVFDEDSPLPLASLEDEAALAPPAVESLELSVLAPARA